MSATLLALRRLPLLPCLIPLCALLAIAELSGWADAPGINGIYRPLTTLLIVLHAAGLPSGDAQRRRAILAGLGCSLVGDCLLVVPALAEPGLWLFVAAQCWYLRAVLPMAGTLRLGLPHALHAVVIAWALAMWSTSRPLPVFVTIAVFMCLLGWLSAQADVWWWRARGTAEAAAARCAALAGLFWLCADLLWTFSRHVTWVPETFAAVMTLYWLAQWHLASLIEASRDVPTSRRESRHIRLNRLNRLNRENGEKRENREHRET